MHSATQHAIISRQKSFPGAVVGLSDFTLGNPSPFDTSEIVRNPHWSLYAIDFARDQAMFVRTPAGVDLARAPFVYTIQFDTADTVALVALDDLIGLSEQVTPPPNIGILFSTGRCGSTLASRILAQIPEVWSLSEPDVLNNLAFARNSVPRDRMVELIRASVRLLSRPQTSTEITTVIIKPRAESLIQASEFAEALPESSNIFMYRDCEGFTNSLYRFAQRQMGPMFGTPEGLSFAWALSTVNADDSLLDEFFDRGNEEFDMLESMVLGWVLRIRAYRKAVELGLGIDPLHYDDLNEDRTTQTARMLEGFGLSADYLDRALRGFDQDAHAGTAGANVVPASPITAAQRERVRSLLARWSEDNLKETRLDTNK